MFCKNKNNFETFRSPPWPPCPDTQASRSPLASGLSGDRPLTSGQERPRLPCADSGRWPQTAAVGSPAGRARSVLPSRQTAKHRVCSPAPASGPIFVEGFRRAGGALPGSLGAESFRCVVKPWGPRPGRPAGGGGGAGLCPRGLGHRPLWGWETQYRGGEGRGVRVLLSPAII